MPCLVLIYPTNARISTPTRSLGKSILALRSQMIILTKAHWNSGEDIPPFTQHSLPNTLKRFSSGYDDPFTEMVTPFDPAPSEQPPDSSIDHNNKLLSFSMPAYNFTLLDYSLRRTSLSLSAQLHGMFFLAESPWTTSPTENAPPQQGAELTCYRRNLFQITGSVTLPRSLRYIMTEQGDRIPILAQELCISATESVEGNSRSFQCPGKRPLRTAINQLMTMVLVTAMRRLRKNPHQFHWTSWRAKTWTPIMRRSRLLGSGYNSVLRRPTTGGEKSCNNISSSD